MQAKHEFNVGEKRAICSRAEAVIAELAEKHYPMKVRWQYKCRELWAGEIPKLLDRIKNAESALNQEVLIAKHIEEFKNYIDNRIQGKIAERTQRDKTHEIPREEVQVITLRQLKRSSSTRFGSKKTLLSSTSGVNDEEALSSDELPLGMNNYQFAVLCNALVKHFDRGNFVYKDAEYQPPEFLCFKGSSVTGVSYAEEKNEKTFGDHSDYDGIFIWKQGINAMKLLQMNNQDKKFPKNLVLDNAAKGLKFLNLHSDDRNEGNKGDCAKRRIFPNGVPHLLFCEDLKSKIRTKHPFNFVVLESLTNIVFADDIVQKKDASSNDLNFKRIHVLEARQVSNGLQEKFYQTEPRCLGQVLVYSWRLIKLYNEHYLSNKFASYDFKFFKELTKNTSTVAIDIEQEVRSQLEWVDEVVYGIQSPCLSHSRIVS